MVDGMKRIKAAAPGIAPHADRAAGAGAAGPRGHLVRPHARVDAGEGAGAARRPARRSGGTSARARRRLTSPSSSTIPAPSCGSGRGSRGNTACRASSSGRRSTGTARCAYPAPKLQDPWADPMSCVSGYGSRPGHVGSWGNGDGRFLYPPPPRSRTPQPTPCLDGPINSIRWENLRDGMEDYEYFWLLDQAVKRADHAGQRSPSWSTKPARCCNVPPGDLEGPDAFHHRPAPDAGAPRPGRADDRAVAPDQVTAASGPHSGKHRLQWHAQVQRGVHHFGVAETAATAGGWENRHAFGTRNDHPARLHAVGEVFAVISPMAACSTRSAVAAPGRTPR